MLPDDSSVYDQYFKILYDIGGNLADVLVCTIASALEPSNTESQFEDWYGLINGFLDQNNFQINDLNKWDYQEGHPEYYYCVNPEYCYQAMLIKFPYLHFSYGLSGGERAFNEIIGPYHPDTSLKRRLKLLDLMVDYWPNHRYASHKSDDGWHGYLFDYFFNAYFLGPEFMAILDPTGEFYTDEWLAMTKDTREEYQAYLDKIAARRADATQNTPEATTKTV